VRVSVSGTGRLFVLLVFFHCSASAADVIVVQCTVDSFRSSFSPRPDLFTLQVDLEARSITNFGTMPLKMTRREIRGAGTASGGWQTNVTINRNTGRLGAGVDKIDGRKYSYADLKGTCILPIELQGAK
jgi:hypothetical protein